MLATTKDIAKHIERAKQASKDFKRFKIDREEYNRIINIARSKITTGKNTINFKLSVEQEKLDKLKEVKRIDEKI